MDVKQNLRAILYDAIIVRNVMDQNDFGKALGESPQNTNKWFNPNFPTAVPNVNHYPKICELLNVSLFDIFGVKDPNNLTDDQQQIIKALNKEPDMVIHVKRLLDINN